MSLGIFGYLLLRETGLHLSAKMQEATDLLPPVLIFLMLLLTFSTINPRHLRLTRWHWQALALQLAISGTLTALALLLGQGQSPLWQGAVMCFICPAATAAAVVTQKLGGKASEVAIYTLLSSLLAALFVPLVFPLLEPHEHLPLATYSAAILGKVSLALVLPFLAAMSLRYGLPRLHARIVAHHGLAFYLWAIALVIVCAKTTHSVLQSRESLSILLLLSAVALVACLTQFYLGRKLSAHNPVTGGQGLGQKNTILAIWIAYTFLNPLSALAPGAYVLWQNLVNSRQLWKSAKK